MKKLLILDIDETLVLSSTKKLAYEHDYQFSDYYVYKRPYLEEFLKYCEATFKVAVWTSSSADYANEIVPFIFGKDYPLEFVWARDKCSQSYDDEFCGYDYVKNLKKVKSIGFNLEQILMIDNTPNKLKKNYGNLIAVESFEGNKRDEEFLDLMAYLEELKQVENVRTVEKRNWKKRRL